MTPYTIRNVVAARLRVRAGTKAARRALGHRTVRSTLVYGGTPDRGPVPVCVLWPEDTPEPVSQPGPEPAPEPEAPAPAVPSA